MGKAKQAKDKAEPDKPLPPAKSIFEVKSKGSEGCRARCGELLGHATPFFTQLTSRGLPQCLRPKVLEALMEGQLLYELPIGDLLLRQESVSGCKEVAQQGLGGFWPHMQGHLTYCAFRNPRQNPSIYGGDALCSVETAGGRRKVGPKELLQTQKIMRADIVAAPGEEVGLDVVAARRGQRAVARASEWLKELLEAKATEPDLGFDWHVLASIQGGGDIKQREKACEASAAMPVAGYWIGGLGYSEPLPKRAEILQAVTAALPAERPRFLPVCSGTPQEVLQGVLLGIDVFELVYPAEAAVGGIALVFDMEMPAEGAEAETEEDCEALLSPSSTSRILPVRQLRLRAAECREDFGPISPSSPVKQYSRAYLYHLHEVHELLGTMLLAQHNFFVYRNFFEAIRRHVREGSIRRYATWFLKTQTCEGPPPEKAPERPSKRQKI